MEQSKNGGIVTLPRRDTGVKDEIKRIQEYVWARHIDGSDHYDHSIDEVEAIAALDKHYGAVGNRNNPDQVYLGILLFERAFECPDEQEELFRRAQRILLFYRKVTGEDDWPAVEDRLEDIASYFPEDAVAAAEPEPAVAAPAETEAAAAPDSDVATAVAEPVAAPVAAPVETGEPVESVKPGKEVAEPAPVAAPEPEAKPEPGVAAAASGPVSPQLGRSRN